MIGTESEKNVARALGSLGFRLIYQSKASRGAFDVLAVYDYHLIGIQCKKCELPCYVEKSLIHRMKHEARKLDWRALLAFDTSSGILFFDVEKIEAGGEKQVRIDENTPKIEDVFSLL